VTVTPCFGNSPKLGVIWHFEQIPRPPQTLSRSTPSCRAAVKTGVPIGKVPRLPDGVKMTSGSEVLMDLVPVCRMLKLCCVGGKGKRSGGIFRSGCVLFAVLARALGAS